MIINIRGLHVKYLLFCPILMKLEFFPYFIEKYSNTTFHGNSSSGSRVFPSGQTEVQTDGQI